MYRGSISEILVVRNLLEVNLREPGHLKIVYWRHDLCDSLKGLNFLVLLASMPLTIPWMLQPRASSDTDCTTLCIVTHRWRPYGCKPPGH